MSHRYKKLWFWQCNIRIYELNLFRDAVIQYFNEISYDRFSDSYNESEKAREARSDINKKLHIVRQYISDAEIPFTYRYMPPPITGRGSFDIDVFTNIFSIHKYEISPDVVIDSLEQAIGIYEADQVSSVIRTCSPLFWIQKVGNYAVSLPLRLVFGDEFYQLKFRGTFFDKILSGIFSLIAVIASVVTIADFFGLKDSGKDFFKVVHFFSGDFQKEVENKERDEAVVERHDVPADQPNAVANDKGSAQATK